MTKLYEIINNLLKENGRLIKDEYRSLSGIHVGIRIHPRVFHEIMSDKDSSRYISLDLQNGLHKIERFPIEINPSVEEYEIVELQKHE